MDPYGEGELNPINLTYVLKINKHHQGDFIPMIEQEWWGYYANINLLCFVYSINKCCLVV